MEFTVSTKNTPFQFMKKKNIYVAHPSLVKKTYDFPSYISEMYILYNKSFGLIIALL